MLKSDAKRRKSGAKKRSEKDCKVALPCARVMAPRESWRPLQPERMLLVGHRLGRAGALLSGAAWHWPVAGLDARSTLAAERRRGARSTLEAERRRGARSNGAAVRASHGPSAEHLLAPKGARWF